ncbi:MAG: hypothetical protein Q7R49_03795 [Candidatus Daviesbacteria bacterium]|nr:hypothetical protein [Candidatus Daviesbacteria bacterium]
MKESETRRNLAEKQARLEKRALKLEERLYGLSQPGWIEKWLEDKNSQYFDFSKRLSGLSLQDSTLLTRLTRFRDRIKPLQIKVQKNSFAINTRLERVAQEIANLPLVSENPNPEPTAPMQKINEAAAPIIPLPDEYLDWLDVEDNLEERKPRNTNRSIRFRTEEYSDSNDTNQKGNKKSAKEKSAQSKYIIDPEVEPIRDYSKLIANPEMKTFLDSVDDISRSLFEQFLQSKNTVKIFNALLLYFQQPTELRKQVFFENSVAGTSFEELGYLHLAPLFEKQNIILLSPDQTFTLYRNANPKAKIMDHDSLGLNKSLIGITIPDAIGLKRTHFESNITLIIDFKLGGSSDNNLRVIRQQKAYEYQLTQSKNLDLDREVSLDYLAGLINLMNPEVNTDSLTVNPRVELKYINPNAGEITQDGVPVTTKDFYRFIRALLKIFQEPANLDLFINNGRIFRSEIQSNEFAVTNSNLNTTFRGDQYPLYLTGLKVLKDFKRDFPELVTKKLNVTRWVDTVSDGQKYKDAMIKEGAELIDYEIIEVLPTDFRLTAEELKKTFVGGDVKLRPLAKKAQEELEKDYPELFLKRNSANNIIQVCTSKALFIQKMLSLGVKLQNHTIQKVQPGEFPIAEDPLKFRFRGRMDKVRPLAEEVVKEIRAVNPDLIKKRKSGTRHIINVSTNEELFIDKMKSKGLELKKR